MIVELVTFQSPSGWDRDHVLEDAKQTIPRWTANRELVRKHFVRGLGEAEGTSVPIPKLANTRGTFSCELRNQRDTSKSMILVPL